MIYYIFSTLIQENSKKHLIVNQNNNIINHRKFTEFIKVNSYKKDLICHYHNLSISQRLHGLWGLIFLFVSQTQDLNNVVDFSILHNLHYIKHVLNIQM